MEAIGLIETRGITASIIGADAMLKSAKVKILEKTIVGGGNVVIVITGDIGAVTAAIEAGESAIKILNSSLFITKNIIPRPEKSLENTVLFPTSSKEEQEETLEEIKVIEEIKIVKDTKTEIKEEKIEIKDKQDEIKEKTDKEIKEVEKEVIKEKEIKKDIPKIEINKLTSKKDLDNIILENELSEVDDALQKLRVKEIRKLARQYEELGIKSKDITTATKAKLIEELKTHYEKNEVAKS